MGRGQTSWTDGRITIDPAICNGKPTIRGLRITVHTILEFLSAGEDEREILRQYPDLDEADIRACLAFAAKMTNHDYQIQDIA